MVLDIIIDIAILFGLGLGGWFLLSLVRMPAAELIGPVVVIGALRASAVDLPTSPDFLFPVAQIVIGIFVGSMLNKAALRELKPMALSALVIIAWALSVVFVAGFFLARYSALDLYTAMLSASMGGLPEITVIALASGAGVTVIMVMQMIRMLLTVLLFPLLLKWMEGREKSAAGGQAGTPDSSSGNEQEAAGRSGAEADRAQEISWRRRIRAALSREAVSNFSFSLRESWLRVTATLLVAAAGGLLLQSVGVPAGLLVGSTVFVAAVSVAGLPVSRLSTRLLDLLLVFIGITVADNISMETLVVIIDPAFLLPILVTTAGMFASSFGVAWIIFRLTGWDFPTSFLAAAPGGFTVMTALAIKHNRDPFKVSMLHLCRLLSINIFIPFVFMYLMR